MCTVNVQQLQIYTGIVHEFRGKESELPAQSTLFKSPTIQKETFSIEATGMIRNETML